jgi:cytochrome c biogenesis protein CcmG/thiol:disulfide interchange protein DsbE
MTRRPLVVFVTLLMATLSSGCTRSSDRPPSAAPTPAANATTAPGLPTTVNALPTTDVAGFEALLDELVGTPAVVNVWASWCEPCKAEAPSLVRAAAADPGVQFVGVDVQDSRDGAETFLGVYGITYPSLFDPPGAIQTELHMLGPPATFFYDAQGRQVDRVLGLLSPDALDAGLAEIRAEIRG